MGNLPQIDAPPRLYIEIPTPAYLRDHLLQDHPVLPAVEAMETLAREIKRAYPEFDVTRISAARFEKFLPLDPEKDHLPALIDLHLSDTGDLHAALMTRTKAPKAAITRTKTHAELIFLKSRRELTPLPLDVAAAPEGICTPVAADRIYEDLVPFGPAFRNIRGTLRLSPDGALAEIKCPALPAPGPPNFLGSPFALDAAFHAACVWAQHYRHVVAFPVGIDERRILIPTKPGSRYFARILPQTMSPDLLVFDIWLLDEAGNLCEMAQGVHMRDVSGGRLAPPAWIALKDQADPLADLRSRCEAMTIVELDAVAPYAEKTLSHREKERFDKMGARRRRSFLAARIALKRLFRCRHEESGQIPAREIETVCADSTKPCCFHEEFASPFYCSLSHDHRFAVAILAPRPAGVDVEEVSDKALKSSRLYMARQERDLVGQSALGQREAAVRVWSTKEAVAKASGINLADTWRQVRMSVIGESESRFSINAKGPFVTVHASVDDHVFTLFR
ncbi:MAG: polyketide synthase dehydratase domain-containing protein [Pseudomonadota bacterium]